MSDAILFTILGDPKAQQRHRSYRHGKFLRQVDPSADDKASFIAQARPYAPAAPWTGPLSLCMTCYLRRPRSHYRTGRHADELRPDAPVFCEKKRDWDNLGKLISDALTGVFYRDDAQIADGRVIKRYDGVPERPRTEITLRKLA